MAARRFIFVSPRSYQSKFRAVSASSTRSGSIANSGMFLLEGPEGPRFLTRSRLYTDEEWQALSTQQGA